MKSKDQFIIGLTGNIGSGKSTVLNMLRHRGAYGIDADALTRKARQQEDIVEKIKDRFGTNKKKELTEIVFSDALALADLEKIIHPRVIKLAQSLTQNATLPVIVIEAIKLFESDMASMCDTIWVVETDEKIVTKRLVNQRGMNEKEIARRLANQTPSAEKKKKADVIINNSISFKNTWQQIAQAWDGIFKQKQFTTFEKQTAIYMKPFNQNLVLPFSGLHNRITSILKQQRALEWIPGGKTLTTKLVESWICKNLLFADENSESAEQFFLWDLNTFSFDLQAFFVLGSPQKSEQLSFNTELYESFANLHRVETLSILNPLPFNNDNVSNMEKYKYRLEETPQTTEWHNAGYNLIVKQLRDTTAYIKESSK